MSFIYIHVRAYNFYTKLGADDALFLLCTHMYYLLQRSKALIIM